MGITHWSRTTYLMLAVLCSGVLAWQWLSPRDEAAPVTPVSVILSWRPGVQFLGFYVAQERGEYQAEGLALTLHHGTDPATHPEIPHRVAAGEVDFGLGGPDTFQAQLDGAPLTVFASFYQRDPAVFFARRSSGIQTPYDLRGRRIVEKNAIWRDDILLPILQRVGLDLADVQLVPGGFDMSPFFRGEVEVWAGFVSNEVVRARRQGLALVTLPVQEYLPRINPNQLYTRRELLATQPALARAFLRASLRGWRWALEHPDAAVDMMLARFPQLAAERDFHLASFDSSVPVIHAPGLAMGAVDCDHWEGLAVRAGMQDPKGLCSREIFSAVAASVGATAPW